MKAINMCLHYLPFILILLVSFLSMMTSIGETEPLYTLNRNSKFHTPMQTKGLKIEYFVADDFNARIVNQYNLNRVRPA